MKSPIVVTVGCASRTEVPHIWRLSSASAVAPSSTVGIATAERKELDGRSLGSATYQLIGVADFVDVATARRIGERGKILSPERVNATSMLVDGSKVAVKGLYVDAKPPRINLTSVVLLGKTCP